MYIQQVPSSLDAANAWRREYDIAILSIRRSFIKHASIAFGIETRRSLYLHWARRDWNGEKEKQINSSCGSCHRSDAARSLKTTCERCAWRFMLSELWWNHDGRGGRTETSTRFLCYFSHFAADLFAGRYECATVCMWHCDSMTLLVASSVWLLHSWSATVGLCLSLSNFTCSCSSFPFTAAHFVSAPIWQRQPKKGH